MKILGFGKQGGIGFYGAISIYDPADGYCRVLYKSGTDDRGWKLAHVYPNQVVHQEGRVADSQIFSCISDPNHMFVVHDGAVDATFCQFHFNQPLNIYGDTYVLACLIPSWAGIPFSFENLMRKKMDPSYQPYLGKTAKDYDWAAPLSDDALIYAGRVVMDNFSLHEKMVQNFGDYAGTVYKLECALIPLFAEMKLEGLYMDRGRFMDILIQNKAECEAKAQELMDLRGQRFNPASKEEIRRWLYKELKLTPLEKTKSGKGSVNKGVLERLDHPAANKIIEFNSLHAVKTTLESIQENKEYDLIDNYMIFHPAAKSVGPNQESSRIYYAPSVTQWPGAVKGAVVNPYGVCYYADCKAFELMIAAYAAGETRLIEAYQAGLDLHSEIAKGLGITRDVAKQVAFSTIYGSMGGSIAKALGVPFEVAEGFIQDFLTRHPKLAAYRQGVYDLVDNTGMAYTAFGRARRVCYPESVRDRREARRQAYNYVCQSTSGDLIKLVLLAIFREQIPGVRIASTVFDSLLLYIPSESVKERLDRVILSALNLKVKDSIWRFRIDSGVGATWEEAKQNALEAA